MISIGALLLEQKEAGVVDPAEAAAAVLKGLTAKDLRIVFLPTVTAQATTLFRNHTRTSEDKVVKDVGRVTLDLADVGDTQVGEVVAQYDPLAAHTFSLPGGRRVYWLQATPGEHRERAEMLRVTAVSFTTKARFHEDTAQFIESQGGTSMESLGDKAQAYLASNRELVLA